MASNVCGTADASAGLSKQKLKPPPSLSVTHRSRHAPPARTNCRTGSASTNSLAMTMSGPCGTSPMSSHQSSGAGEDRNVARCVSRRLGLVSTSAMVTRSRSPGTRPNTRSASAISVPRPGPSSAMTAARPAHGLPDGRRPDANQLAEHLADLGRGDEVAVFADRLPRRVIAGAGVGEAGLHIVMHADRPVARDPLLQPRRKRALFGAVRLALRAHHDDARAGLRLARQISHAPTRIMGME